LTFVFKSDNIITRPGWEATVFCYNSDVCVGAPAPGNTIATNDTVCYGGNTRLSLQNTTVGLGVTYQWHSSFDGTSYSPISGATSATLTANITTPQYFYCAVTCSGSTQNSGPVSVALNSFYNCYCSAIPSSTADEEIVNVSIGSLNNSSTCTTLAPGPGSTVARYSNYVSGSGSPAAPIIYTGSLTSGTVTISSCGTSNYTSGLAIFVDLNRDGDYTDAGEKVYTSGSTSNINCVPATVKQISFTIPSTTTSGLTTMRIINAESNSGDAITSCFAYGWGETEDYLIDLVALPLCSGTPNPGNTLSSVVSVLPNGSTSLSLQTETIGLGVTYQWQSSSDNVTWTDISGATSATYAATNIASNTYYRCNVTCSGNTGTSTPVLVSVSYCTTLVTGLSVNTVTQTSANITWTAPTIAPLVGYDYYFSTTNTAPTAGTTPSGSVMVGTTTAALSGLTANTTYYYWVRTNCGTNDVSGWSAQGAFLTPCLAISSYPFNESFSTNSPTAGCWRVINGNGDSDAWTYSTSNPYDAGGRHASLWTDYNSSNKDYLITPQLDLGSGSKLLRFYVRHYSNAEPDNLNVRISTTGSAIADFANGNLLTLTTSQITTTYTQYTVDISSYTGLVYLAFAREDAPADGWYLYIDEVSVVDGSIPTAATTIVGDCQNNQFFVNVDVTYAGIAGQTVNISSDYANNPGAQVGVGVGSYQVGPFPSGSSVNISVENSQNSATTAAITSNPHNYTCTENSLAFDGVDDMVRCGESASVNIVGGALTLEAWIYPTAWRTYAYQGNIINKELPSSGGYTLRCGANGTLSFNIGNGTGWNEITQANALTLNTWQHVAGTYDGTTLRLFVNGVQVNASAQSSTIAAAPGQQLTIGNWSQSGARGFVGRIDEARVWAVTKTEAEILAGMTQSAGMCDAGLRASYSFNHGNVNATNTYYSSNRCVGKRQ